MNKSEFMRICLYCKQNHVELEKPKFYCPTGEKMCIRDSLKTEFADNPFFWGIKTIMTIHNLRFQGVWDIKTMRGLSGLPDELFTPDKLEFKKDANMLKGGIVYSDFITTVSNTYAQEIQTAYYGEGLDRCV